MNNKFGRVKMFVDELEKVELVENEEALMLLGSSGGSGFYGTGNNCKCNGNNCDCNTVLGCGNTGESGGSGGSGGMNLLCL